MVPRKNAEQSGSSLVVEVILLPMRGTGRRQLPTIVPQGCQVIWITGLAERCPLPRQLPPLLYFTHPSPGGTCFSPKAGPLRESAKPPVDPLITTASDKSLPNAAWRRQAGRCKEEAPGQGGDWDSNTLHSKMGTWEASPLMEENMFRFWVGGKLLTAVCSKPRVPASAHTGFGGVLRASDLCLHFCTLLLFLDPWDPGWA